MNGTIRALRRTFRAEFLWLAALFCAVAVTFGFFALASEVAEGDTLAFDRAILLALRDADNPADPIGPPWVEVAMKDLTSLGGFMVLTLMTVAAVAYLLVAGKRHAAVLLGAAVGGGALLSAGLKILFQRPRPDLVPHIVDVASASFPSGHALLAATTYLTLGALLARVQPRRRLKIYLFSVAALLALAIGASRVYLGVHYPSDVLAGWTVGAAWAMWCWVVAAWLQRRGQVEGPPPELDADAAGEDAERR